VRSRARLVLIGAVLMIVAGAARTVAGGPISSTAQELPDGSFVLPVPWHETYGPGLHWFSGDLSGPMREVDVELREASGAVALTLSAEATDDFAQAWLAEYEVRPPLFQAGHDYDVYTRGVDRDGYPTAKVDKGQSRLTEEQRRIDSGGGWAYSGTFTFSSSEPNDNRSKLPEDRAPTSMQALRRRNTLALPCDDEHLDMFLGHAEGTALEGSDQDVLDWFKLHWDRVRPVMLERLSKSRAETGLADVYQQLGGILPEDRRFKGQDVCAALSEIGRWDGDRFGARRFLRASMERRDPLPQPFCIASLVNAFERCPDLDSGYAVRFIGQGAPPPQGLARTRWVGALVEVFSDRETDMPAEVKEAALQRLAAEHWLEEPGFSDTAALDHIPLGSLRLLFEGLRQAGPGLRAWLEEASCNASIADRQAYCDRLLQRLGPSPYPVPVPYEGSSDD